MTGHLELDARLSSRQLFAWEPDEYLALLVDPVPPLLLKARRHEPPLHFSGNMANEVQIAGRIRAARQELDGRTANEHRRVAVVEALDPSDQLRRLRRPVGEAQDLLDTHNI